MRTRRETPLGNTPHLSAVQQAQAAFAPGTRQTVHLKAKRRAGELAYGKLQLRKPSRVIGQAELEALAVWQDKNGVLYLSTGEMGEGSRQFIVEKAGRVALVQVEAQSIRSMGLLGVTKITPLQLTIFLYTAHRRGVEIDSRAGEHLNLILHSRKKLEQIMATKKATKKSAKVSNKKSNGAPRSGNAIVTFKKAAKEGELPKQAVVVLETVKKNSGKTVSEVIAKIDKKALNTVQEPSHIWAFYRARLLAAGYMAIAAPEVSAA